MDESESTTDEIASSVVDTAPPHVRRWPFLLGALLFFAGSVTLLPEVLRPGVVQPIAFSHKKHTQEVGLECEDCHTTVRTEAFAGLPALEICMTCHEEAQTDSPEEEKLRQAAESGTPVPWARLFEQPSHVYYSHRRHVGFGQIDCETCHGAIGLRTGEDTGRPANLTMDVCIACHEKTEAGVDCTDCHR